MGKFKKCGACGGTGQVISGFLGMQAATSPACGGAGEVWVEDENTEQEQRPTTNGRWGDDRLGGNGPDVEPEDFISIG